MLLVTGDLELPVNASGFLSLAAVGFSQILPVPASGALTFVAGFDLGFECVLGKLSLLRELEMGFDLGVAAKVAG